MRHLSQPTLRLADHNFAERIPQRRIRKVTIYPPIPKETSLSCQHIRARQGNSMSKTPFSFFVCNNSLTSTDTLKRDPLVAQHTYLIAKS